MEHMNPDLAIHDIKRKKSAFWVKTGERETLRLFHAAAQRVPAYKDFLKKARVNPAKVKTLRDFELVPPTSKEHYLHAYPYESLFWDGSIKKPLTIHATSGSTGEATYFQRDNESDLVREVIIENFFRNNEKTIEGPTLFIITFGMGVWSAGMGIHAAAYLASNMRKLPISVISPGLNKIEVTKILKNLAPRFRQVVIAGYPPFVKDIIDNAIEDGINVRAMNLRAVFTGEAFTEEFRDYLAEKKAVKNIFTDTMNTYGTSELGAVAVETPLTILGRRLAYDSGKIFEGLFGGTLKTPTLAQYIPHFVNFECVEGELFLTGRSPAPLVRYQSGDHGGLLSFDDFNEVLSANGISLRVAAKRERITPYINQLPLVYVYERKNLATTLYGVLIFPEFVKSALFHKNLTRFLTSKFTMITKYDTRRNQYLEINLELRRNHKLKREYAKMAERHIVETLRRKSSEFRELSDQVRGRPLVRIAFWEYEHPKYFMLGNKHKWVKKL